MATGTTMSRNQKDWDQAYNFLSTKTFDGTSHVDLRRLRRKVDWRIIPLMFLCYWLQFLDKVSLNYAAIMGLVEDLDLKGNDFSNTASYFFVAYLIAEVPNGFILNKVPVGKWLGINVTLWGIATACTAATHDYGTLLAARIMLGIFEAAIAPSLMLLSSQWYTRSEQAPRFVFWYLGLGFGQLVGSILSFAFQHVSPSAPFTGWRIMFVTLGCATVVSGIATTILMPDSPMTARFLTDKEKTALLDHVSGNRTGIVNTRVKSKQLLEILLDLQVWLLVFMTISISVSSGVITTYSAILLANIGFSPERAALLNCPSGAVSIVTALIAGFGTRYAANRWAWVVACALPAVVGAALMSFLNTKAGVLAGIWLVNTVTGTLIIIYHWTAANVAGQTKRCISIALVSASFSVGAIIGPQTFREKDAPEFLPAKISVMATMAGGALLAFVLFLYYCTVNKRRDRKSTGHPEAEITMLEEKWANLTDKENPAFRYVY